MMPVSMVLQHSMRAGRKQPRQVNMAAAMEWVLRTKACKEGLMGSLFKGNQLQALETGE